MTERANPSLQLPGYFAGPYMIPGQAKNLITRVQAGYGELGAEQAAAQRMFRTREADEYTAPIVRKPTTPAEVTAGLGLPSDVETRVQRVIEETRADFSKKGQTQRSFIAQNSINETLRRMSDVPSDARMEIAKRARAYWHGKDATDYGKEPTVRAPQREQARVGKSQRFVISEERLMKKMGAPPPKKKPSAKAPQKRGPLAKQREADLAEAKKNAPPVAAKQPRPMPGAAQPAPAPGLAQFGPQVKMGASPPPTGAQPQSGVATPTTPPGASQAPQPGASAGGGADTQHPPPGFSPIPNSKKGGFRKQSGAGFQYWYPGSGITSTPHPADQQPAGRTGVKPPAGGPAGAAAPPPGAPQPGAAQPPPLPTKGAAGAAQPAQAQAPGTPPAPPQGQAGAPQPGTQPGMPAPQGAQPPQGGPAMSSAKPRIEQGPQGEMRHFHPQVQAHVPQGKENDPQHHAGEFNRHRALKQQAMGQGDMERAKAHTFAMNFHADRHNRAAAQMQGRQYQPKQPFPGADDGGLGDTVKESYERVPGSASGKDGKPASAAAPRERFVPEGEAVKGMRERIGRAVHIMADLSAAHDHLSSLKSKRLQAKQSGSPLARRLMSQIDAEIAATRHDIVQMEDAHSHAMNEVAQFQGQVRNEKIRANPIFRALMTAMQSLSGLSQKVGAKLGEAAGGALDSARGAVDDIKNRGAREQQAKERGAFDQALASGDKNPESGEVKPLGVSKEDVDAQFGSPEQDQAESERGKAAKETLSKLAQMQGDDAETAAPEDVEELPDEGGTGGEEAVDGGIASEGDLKSGDGGLITEEDVKKRAGAAEPSEAEAALKDIFGLQKEREGAEAAQKQKQSESQGFDQSIASAKQKRDTMERRASAQAEVRAQRMAGRSKTSVMRAALDPSSESGEQKVQSANENAGTMATGKRAKRVVQKSAVLVKSAEWREVMRLGHQALDVLKKAAAPRLVISTRALIPNLGG